MSVKTKEGIGILEVNYENIRLENDLYCFKVYGKVETCNVGLVKSQKIEPLIEVYYKNENIILKIVKSIPHFPNWNVDITEKSIYMDAISQLEENINYFIRTDKTDSKLVLQDLNNIFTGIALRYKYDIDIRSLAVISRSSSRDNVYGFSIGIGDKIEDISSTILEFDIMIENNGFKSMVYKEYDWRVIEDTFRNTENINKLIEQTDEVLERVFSMINIDNAFEFEYLCKDILHIDTIKEQEAIGAKIYAI